MARRGAAADGAAGPRWKPAHRMGWRPALAQVRRLDSYRARGGEARQGPRHAVPGRRQAGGGFCAARPGADALAPRAEVGFRSGGDFQSRPALRRDVMQTGLADFIRDTPEGAEADAILRKCVHCGFCTATCPTYQILGDDLDSPRGRIYLIKRALEGAEVTQRTRLHLDRCLTCRACETTCPSGVRYGRLVDIGRRVVEERTRRTPWDRLQRAAMSFLLPRTGLFAAALSLGRLSRPFLPLALKTKIPAKTRVPGPWPMPRHRRKMLVLGGCVQPALAPGINAAAARVLDRLGVSLLEAPGAGCCGGIRFHLNRQEAGRDDMRAGYQLTSVRDAHLCCGSAGTYSLLQPAIAGELRARKLAALHEGLPLCIATANIGCLSHLQVGTDTPVRHWIELLDDALERKMTP